MRARRFLGALLAMLLAVSWAALPASAAACTEDSAAIVRASGHLNHSIPANTCASIGGTFSLEAGETISYNCSYSPVSASMDFGYIGPDGRFHFINSTDGSIDESIKVSRRGEYQLAVRNNESYEVSVIGTVNY